MNVLDLIREEHVAYKDKVTKITAAKGDSKKEIFRELHTEIHGHHEAEEAVVFTLFREKENEKLLEAVLELIEEHRLLTYQFSVLEKTSVENETWDAKFSVLKEILIHHLEEEEKEFLPKAKKMISEEKLVEILDTFEDVLEVKMKEKKMDLGKII